LAYNLKRLVKLGWRHAKARNSSPNSTLKTLFMERIGFKNGILAYLTYSAIRKFHTAHHPYQHKLRNFIQNHRQF
ncbi:hypothetical protein, partial [Maribacter sp. 4U21]